MPVAAFISCGLPISNVTFLQAKGELLAMLYRPHCPRSSPQARFSAVAELNRLFTPSCYQTAFLPECPGDYGGCAWQSLNSVS
ncbi:hypothetical protein ERY430_80287 [Erythrobacter sp. EC-HK427]|nr:hypothetical protein ERY430_80287 [Erythrobacter sp. EC-HK427]